ncbi:carboxylic acid reductase [Amycolatopsis sp. NPDC004368]
MATPPIEITGTEQRVEELLATQPQLRDAVPDPTITEAIRRPGLPLVELIETVMTGYAERAAFAERAGETVTDPATGRMSRRLLPRFDTVTYREAWERAGALAGEWTHHADHPVAAGDFVATLGFISTEYSIVDLACVRAGVVSVPLQAGATAGTLRPIVTETGPKLLASNVDNLDTAVDLVLDAATVQRLVVFDYHPETDREKFEAARARLAAADSAVVLEPLAAVLERGATAAPAPVVEADPERLSLLVYTSGSTGTPKGAMYPDRLVANLWLGMFPERPAFPVVNLNFLPLSHIMGRALLVGTLAVGGTVHFAAKSDLSTLFEDVALTRPTELVVVPRICDMIFQHYQSELDRRALGAGYSAELENEVKLDLRSNFLGGRITWAGFGSAPLSADLQAFVESLLGIELHDAYGSTEAGIVLWDHVLMRPAVVDYKLDDVPELGYYSTDTPHPRGELLLKARSVVPGYYQRPDATAEVFDAEGYYRTGDVMAETAPDTLHYLDRRKNVLKLSQGEFVAVSRLEAEFAAAPAIRQIYLYGSSERAYLLAVIVPTPEALETFDDTEKLKAQLSESLQSIVKESDLNSYEIPRDFLVETEPFSPENGLLTGIRKLARPKLKEHYGERLELLYHEIAEREASELRELRQVGLSQPVFDTVARAAQALLGSASGELSPEAHFVEMGGDSLSALSFSNLLREIFDVEVPVGVVISPATDLRKLAAYIEDARESGARRPTFAAVHGAGSTEARADALTLDKFLDAATLEAARTVARPSGTVATVLLTGANGYLGRFLCLEWLERLAESGGRLVCLVRGSSAETAYRRLEAAFDSGDAELLRHFRELAADHLEVLAGDIGEPDLGLDAPTWRRLAETVDLIVHPAALVNHVLPYDQLFGPNVVGTAELMRMALTTRLKPITYLSTVAVVADQASSGDEVSDIRVTSPVRRLGDGYASGYATSKWAGEVLLREANDAFSLPVATFRSDMILAHSRFSGQLNVPDMFTRLLLSLIVTGIAPGSFYSSPAPAHYDGLPADFTAEAITTLGLQATEGYRTYNVLNPHEDGVSLDTIVDWLAAAGHPIQRIDDHATWFARFETAIRGLPEKQKQHSAATPAPRLRPAPDSRRRCRHSHRPLPLGRPGRRNRPGQGHPARHGRADPEVRGGSGSAEPDLKSALALHSRGWTRSLRRSTRPNRIRARSDAVNPAPGSPTSGSGHPRPSQKQSWTRPGCDYPVLMGHKGIRDGGPPRDPAFRPEDVVGLPIRKAVIELTRHGYLIDTPTTHDRTLLKMHNRVRLTASEGVITGVTVG